MLNVKRAALAAATLLIAACSGDTGKVLGPSAGPVPDISDAAHAGAVPGFYFLPPMVPAPTFSGSFDPALSPRVEICLVSGASCGATLATYTTSSGTGSEVVRVSTADQLYAVNWRTDLFNLDPAKTYRISVFVGTTRLGFADVDVVSSGRELKNVNTQQFIPLVDDRTLPIKFRIETGIVGQVVVAPAADTVNVGETAQFTATLLDLHGSAVSGPTVSWSSSDPAVATISSSGLATGVAPGTVTITASLGYVSGTASLTVVQPNHPPVSADDSFDAIGNLTVPVPAPGVLANDTDPDGNALTATPGTITTANGGKVTMNADGSFTYLSAPGFTGSDSFTYTATDGIATSTSTVTVAVPTRVWYVSNAGTAPGDGRDASPFATLKGAESASAAGETIFLLAGDGSTSGYDQGIVLKAGQSLTGQGISSNLTATLNGQSVVLLAAGSAPTVTRASAGATIQLAANNTVQGVQVASSNGAGIVGSGFGTFTAGALSVATQGGPALDLANGTVAASLGNVSSSNSAGAGLDLSGLSGTLTAIGGSVSGAAGTGVSVSGGSADISYAGDVSGSGTRAVSVTGRTGGTVTLSGSISDSGGGILVQNNTGGTVAFTGSTKALSTSASAAVTLASNGGASVLFAGGGLSIATTTGTGFLATGGGTVTVTGANNAIGSTSGTALRVENTDVGASGLTFRSISASNGANGIVLVNTGAQGGVQVTGTGSAGSGGTIQNMTGAGVSLNSTRSPSFAYMNIQNTGRSGINGAEVTNFSFTNGVINNSGTAAADNADSNIDFYAGAAPTTETNLSGTVTITGNTLTNARGHGIHIGNGNGTISDLNVSNNTITSTASTTSSFGSGMRIVIDGSASTVAHLTKANISDNVITNFPSEAGILVDCGNGSASGAAGTCGTTGSATNKVVITGNRIAGDATTRMGTRAINVIVAGLGQGSFDISNNGTAAEPIRNIVGNVIDVSAFGQAQVSATIAGNRISANNVLSSRGIALGADQATGFTTTAVLTATVTNNNVSNTSGSGIVATATRLGTVRAAITNNTVGTPVNGTYGIQLASGTSSVSTDATMCVQLQGNTTSGGTASGSTFPGIGLRKQGTTPTTNVFGIVGLSPSPAGTPTVENYVNGQNTSASGTFGTGGTALISATSGFTSCTL